MAAPRSAEGRHQAGGRRLPAADPGSSPWPRHRPRGRRAPPPPAPPPPAAAGAGTRRLQHRRGWRGHCTRGEGPRAGSQPGRELPQSRRRGGTGAVTVRRCHRPQVSPPAGVTPLSPALTRSGAVPAALPPAPRSPSCGPCPRGRRRERSAGRAGSATPALAAACCGCWEPGSAALLPLIAPLGWVTLGNGVPGATHGGAYIIGVVGENNSGVLGEH